MTEKLTLSRDASNRLTVEIPSAEASEYKSIAKEIVNQFKLEKANEMVVGLDEIFQEYKKGTCLVGLEWDNWSGFSVVAKNVEAEELVNEISKYLLKKHEKKT